MVERDKPGFAIWFTGLPASGKSSLARETKRLLRERGIPVQILDSDELRKVLTPEPDYSQQERDWFYDVLVYLAGLLTDNGANVLIAATASRQSYRRAARARLARFAEVYMDCPPQACQQRDPKGLWAKAAAGEIANFPGVDAPYEIPLNPEVRVDAENTPPAQGARRVLNQLEEQGFF